MKIFLLIQIQQCYRLRSQMSDNVGLCAALTSSGGPTNEELPHHSNNISLKEKNPALRVKFTKFVLFSMHLPHKIAFVNIS